MEASNGGLSVDAPATPELYRVRPDATTRLSTVGYALVHDFLVHSRQLSVLCLPFLIGD